MFQNTSFKTVITLYSKSEQYSNMYLCVGIKLCSDRLWNCNLVSAIIKGDKWNNKVV